MANEKTNPKDSAKETEVKNQVCTSTELATIPTQSDVSLYKPTLEERAKNNPYLKTVLAVPTQCKQENTETQKIEKNETTALAKIQDEPLKPCQDEWYPQYQADWKEGELLERDRRRFEQKKGQLQELLQMKLDYVRKVAQIKREYEPQKELTFVTSTPDQPVLNTPCPRGKGPGYCYTHPCDNHSECIAEGRINRVDFRKCMVGVTDLA